MPLLTVRNAYHGSSISIQVTNKWSSARSTEFIGSIPATTFTIPVLVKILGAGAIFEDSNKVFSGVFQSPTTGVHSGAPIE
jgi:hypothetical protein